MCFPGSTPRSSLLGVYLLEEIIYKASTSSLSKMDQNSLVYMVSCFGQVLAVVGLQIPDEDPTSPTWLMNAKTQSMEQIPNLMVATWRLARCVGSFMAGFIG